MEARSPASGSALCAKIGGWNDNSLTEDTDLTYRLLLAGWKTVYQNRSECYEEVPETWQVRIKQIMPLGQRHNQVLVAYGPELCLASIAPPSGNALMDSWFLECTHGRRNFDCLAPGAVSLLLKEWRHSRESSRFWRSRRMLRRGILPHFSKSLRRPGSTTHASVSACSLFSFWGLW